MSQLVLRVLAQPSPAQYAGPLGYLAIEVVGIENGETVSFVEQTADSLKRQLPECRGVT